MSQWSQWARRVQDSTEAVCALELQRLAADLDAEIAQRTLQLKSCGAPRVAHVCALQMKPLVALRATVAQRLDNMLLQRVVTPRPDDTIFARAVEKCGL